MISEFSLQLVCGMSLMWALMPRGEVTAGFFRIQMMVALGLSVLAALTTGRLTDTETEFAIGTGMAGILCGSVAACAYVGSVLWTLNRRTAGAVCVFAILALSAATLILSTSTAASLTTNAGIVAALGRIATSGTLGASMTGMLLGHWYLTAPTMSTAPLKQLILILGGATLCRLLISAIVLPQAWPALVSSNHTVWIVLRWVTGIAGPLVVAVMGHRILRYGNTQAATGVLFVAVILTFIGEMTATLLFQELGLPL